MKENSIEESRERLEKRIKDIWFSTIYSQEQEEKDLKIVLSDYKRVLKENEELKNQEATQRKINELLVQRYSNSISVQKVKDKIEQYKKMLLSCNRFSDAERIKAINERILELEELLKGRKQNVQVL